MKKIFKLFVLIMLLISPVFANEIPNEVTYEVGDEVLIVINDKKMQDCINRIGYRILNANKLKNRVSFVYSNKKIINAYATYFGSKVVMYKGIFQMLDNEDEIAAIMCHEIAHCIDYSDGVLKGTFSFIPMSFAPRRYEKKADLRGIDLMVKAGYNPVAMITALNKIAGQIRFEIFSSHPNGSKRLLSVYEYIYLKYPTFLVNNEYHKNPYYQNFLIHSQEARLKMKPKLKKILKEEQQRL